MKTIEIRNVSYGAAKKEILAYIKDRKRVYASDISEALRLDLGLVFRIMKDLERENVVK